MRIWKRILPLLLALALLSGCAQTGSAPEQAPYLDAVVLEEVELEYEAVALADAPGAVCDFPLPEASGTKTKKNAKATVDYSNAQDGYVMVNFTAQSDKRLKAKVIGPNTPDGYQYNLVQGEWAVFPLSDGNGSYQVKVYEKKSSDPNDKKYAVVLTASFSVTLSDEFAPFLRPNQYVNYTEQPNTIAKAAELVGDETDALKKVEKIYDYVVNNFTYDKAKAKNVQSGYLPVLDSVLEAKTGICFDYAALMTAMLRTQGVPCKLVVGYAGPQYHAWIDVWSEETGWVDAAIFFNGTAWQRMDPTFASSANSSSDILNYIGDGSHYNALFLY